MDRRVFGTDSTKEFLEIIGVNTKAWRKSAAWLGIGTVLNILGIGLLTILINEAGGQLLGTSSLLIFLSGALFWIVGMAFRIGVEPLAAEQLAETSDVPAWFEGIQAWNTSLGLIYMVLGYIATAIVGWALIETSLVSVLIGLISLVFGAGGAISMLTNSPKYPGTEYSIAAIPLWLHLMPFLIGVALIIQP